MAFISEMDFAKRNLPCFAFRLRRARFAGFATFLLQHEHNPVLARKFPHLVTDVEHHVPAKESTLYLSALASKTFPQAVRVGRLGHDASSFPVSLGLWTLSQHRGYPLPSRSLPRIREPWLSGWTLSESAERRRSLGKGGRWARLGQPQRPTPPSLAALSAP